LEGLANGVPLVAIPVANDQPGVASRIRYTGTGVSVPMAEVTVPKLSALITEVLNGTHYKVRAQSLKHTIAAANGLEKAVNLLERAFTS
jgi:zeaxanthin glucosyltransferase